MSQLNQSGREDAFPFSLSFCSIQALTGLDDAHPHWGRQSHLLSQQIQTLILFRNTLKNRPRNNV